MSYEVIKGWPQDGALDMHLEKESGEEINPGMLVKVNSSGKIEKWSAEDNDDSIDGFTIDFENARKGINQDYDPEQKSFTVLMNECVLWIDDDHYDNSTSISIGDKLTADDGKFVKQSGDKPAIAKVIYKDTNNDWMRVLYYGNK